MKADKAEYTECIKTSCSNPYIMRLALSAAIGGLLFGYDTGVISGALLYIKEDFEVVARRTWLQETIVAMAVAVAVFGAGIGGWTNDRLGRKPTILAADVLFLIGATIMAVAPSPWVIIIGRIFVGLGVGMASMTAPLYISETSPARIRGALVSTNGLLITGGQFLSYLINLGFSQVKGTWRWMIGLAAVPALLQLILMFSLPESPRWLYRKNKVIEAETILARIYPEEQVEEDKRSLKSSVELELAEEGSVGGGNLLKKLKQAWSNKVVGRNLQAGITVQVAQQFVGINTVMYYSPTIVQLAGFASKSTALALCLITSGLNVVGSLLSMAFVDMAGRRKLMIISMLGIISCLLVLTVNSTCAAYKADSNPGSWSCMTCLKAASDCAFCANKDNQQNPGACVTATNAVRDACQREKRVYFTEGCPSKLGMLAVIFLGAYIISYSPGMGTVPWIISSEIYPLR